MTHLNRVVVTGGTGFIGRALLARLAPLCGDIRVLSRNPAGTAFTEPSIRTVPFPETLETVLDGASAVINLAGAPVAGRRFTARAREEITRSRVETTRRLSRAILKCPDPPAVFLSGSAVGYYGPREEVLPDETAPPGDDFLARVCVEWEDAARTAESGKTRVVLLRTGLVLHPSGGMLKKVLLPFRCGLGGPIGSGQQWLSWISLQDEISLILHALITPGLSGPVNLTAPNPVPMSLFARQLGKYLKRPAVFRVPEGLLNLILGEAATILTRGQRALPAAALASGYRFKHERLDFQSIFSDAVSPPDG